jgi:hypothetical protein
VRALHPISVICILSYFLKLNIHCISSLFVLFFFYFFLLKIDFRDRTIKFYYIVITFSRTKGDCFFIISFYVTNIKVIILIIFIITNNRLSYTFFSGIFLNNRTLFTKITYSSYSIHLWDQTTLLPIIINCTIVIHSIRCIRLCIL